MSKLSKFLSNPRILVPHLGARGFFHGMDDAAYLKFCYRAYLGYELDLDNPTTFNEELQWLKIHDRNPLYTKLVDKAEVKPWVAGHIGWGYVVPTYGVWNSFDEIEFDSLPERFVLKCTHDSGGLAICRDRSTFEFDAARKKIGRALARNFFWSGREWPYKNVKPRILAEEYLEPAPVHSGEGAGYDEMTDYKFYCFDGEPKFLYVSQGLENHETARLSFLSLDWEFAPFWRNDYEPFEELPPKPGCLEEMIHCARVLSEGIPFVRVDLYENRGRVLFSEMTFHPCSGFMPINSHEADVKMGAYMRLPASS